MEEEAEGVQDHETPHYSLDASFSEEDEKQKKMLNAKEETRMMRMMEEGWRKKQKKTVSVREGMVTTMSSWCSQGVRRKKKWEKRVKVVVKEMARAMTKLR